ncbi:endoplasmic reticulum-Golgi intermediate compartment protein 3-like isoform X3 [Oscarella lobularis]|uniref:endoplasmic reticulum-Golgi intermediate compartment protein 3-like isoform X3 n=1 Tax=Oscarella lobularis TaxID=121494 RepID=UPI0033141709
MSSKGFLGRLKQFDAYPKTLEDFRIKTFGGATVTIVSGIIMLVLFVSELHYFLQTEVNPELFVDTSKGQKIRINLDVSFPRLACAYLSIDAMDISGEHQLDVDHHIVKVRLDKEGKAVAEPEKHTDLGEHGDSAEKKFLKAVSKDGENEKKEEEKCKSCYGAETEHLKCCNTCEDVREAYRRKGWAFVNPDGIEQCEKEGWSDKIKAQKNEGCRVSGYLEVAKVAGNFHFAPGKSFQQSHVHVHDLQPFGVSSFNISHTFHRLSFGTDYPGIQNPLDGRSAIDNAGSMMYQYFVKVVPTVYKKLSGKVIRTNQYSVTKHEKGIKLAGGLGEQGLPGLFVLYDLSPMMVQITESRRSFMHFLTGVCAIIGGVFTVAGLIDSMIYHSMRSLQKKMELGKHT